MPVILFVNKSNCDKRTEALFIIAGGVKEHNTTWLYISSLDNAKYY